LQTVRHRFNIRRV